MGAINLLITGILGDSSHDGRKWFVSVVIVVVRKKPGVVPLCQLAYIYINGGVYLGYYFLGPNLGDGPTWRGPLPLKARPA